MTHQETLDRLAAYVDSLVATSTAEKPTWNIEFARGSAKINRWNYVDGCMITALLAMYEMTKDRKYLDFADEFVGYFVQEDGSIYTYSPENYNLDNVAPGRNLFTLYELTGKEKYRKAMDTIRSQLEKHPRTADNSFWHKDIYYMQVWLDGLFMAQPFYMEYEKKFGTREGCKDSVHQFSIVEKRMKDPKTGLYFHGYDSVKQIFWADKETGLSKNFWLRALGWFTLALTDTIERMPEDMAAEKAEMTRIFKNLIDDLLPWQHESGMFYQVINAIDDPRNYLETSGTMLIASGILKGVRLGLLPAEYRQYGEKAFYGTADRYLKQEEDGTLTLGGICLVAGLGPEKDPRRDGTLDYYFSEPVVVHEAKGVAPMILAYTELIRK